MTTVLLKPVVVPSSFKMVLGLRLCFFLAMFPRNYPDCWTEGQLSSRVGYCTLAGEQIAGGPQVGSNLMTDPETMQTTPPVNQFQP